MTKAAIYARYSSDLQSDASIEDQIRLCKEKAAREGWQVAGCYTDHATSGASMMRPGIQQLMQDAAATKFDVALGEALDRLSRDQEDIAAIYKRLSFAGVKLETLSEGEISPLHIGLKGTMNALFLKDLADKTRRGLRGRVEQGKSGGGLTYGYDVVRSHDERGGRTVNETEAATVVRIFQEYAAGRSPRAIAQQLNKEDVPGPSGKGWGPSTIHGNRRRGTGILNNELYIGRLIWNRLRYIKDPNTGKRISRLNPEEEWIVQHVPDLRIVDQGLWDKVKAKQGEINRKDTALWAKNRPRNLFSFLLKCGECGGGCSMISKTHLGCSNARNKGTCNNRLSVSRERLEEKVLGVLRSRLMEPELCEAFCREYAQHMNRLRKNHNAALKAYRKEHEETCRKLSQMVDAIADGAPVGPIKDRMHELENRRVELEESLNDTEETPVRFHPNIAERYHGEVQTLIKSLNSPDHREEAATIVRSLIDKIVLTPAPERDRLTVDLIGDLAGILAIATKSDKSLVSSGLSGFNPDKQEAMVAGVGFEPTTFRL